MRIDSREPLEDDRERVVVVPETLDDLWHLKYVLEPGDQVTADTTRRIQRDDDRLRDTGGRRESMRLTIEVAEVEFHKFANRLRVQGKIVSCSREDQLGFHHTLNIEPFDELSIEKVFKPDQINRLEDAAEEPPPDVGIVTVEEGLAYIHTVSDYGTDEYASISGPTGKGEFARSRSELFESLSDALKHLDVDALILAGPGFTKQDAYAYIEDNEPAIADKITMVDTSSVGDRGVHEVLKRGEVDEILAETRIAAEAELIDELMYRINEGVKAVYGSEATAEAAEYGAVETLLVVDERLREERENTGDWDVEIDSIITDVEHQGGEVVVFSSEFDPGEQLSALGGIAALLRYRLS